MLLCDGCRIPQSATLKGVKSFVDHFRSYHYSVSLPASASAALSWSLIMVLRMLIGVLLRAIKFGKINGILKFVIMVLFISINGTLLTRDIQTGHQSHFFVSFFHADYSLLKYG